ncbi:MAG: tetratricopeptide repeat protein, partial [Planctomycetota bacterium]|nr:tetratricopeptide repeat protein [Planctomycetota bacterium]
SAEPLIRETLAAHLERYPEKHPRVFSARAHLASVLSDQGLNAEALEIYDVMLPQAQAMWGPDHRNVLTMRSNRAVELEILGEHDRAWAEQTELVDLSVRLLGASHPDTLNRMANTAGVATSLGKFDLASEYFQQVLEAYDETQVDPFSRIVVLNNLAFSLERQGKREDALVIQRRATADYEEHLEDGNMSTLISRNNLAILLMKTGHAEASVVEANKNYEMGRKYQAGHKFVTFPFRMNLGRCLAAAERFEDAEVELLAVYGELQGDPGATDASKARIREVLAQTYQAWGKEGEAAKYLDATGE